MTCLYSFSAFTSPGFYLSFWQMSSYDLYYPKDKYSEMEKSLLTTSDQLTTKARQAERSTDRSIRASASGFRVQRDRYISAVSELRKEKAIQESVYRYTMEKDGRLDREKDYWFSHGQYPVVRVDTCLTYPLAQLQRAP